MKKQGNQRSQGAIADFGGPTYPALSWLMKSYPEHAGMTEQMKHYSYRQSRA